MEFWRRAARPIEREFIRAREDIRAVITDAERNVPHERDAPLRGVRFHFAPLFVRDPLHVTKEILASPERWLSLLRQMTQPLSRVFHSSVFRSTFVPRLRIALLLHHRAKECVILPPPCFFLPTSLHFLF